MRTVFIGGPGRSGTSFVADRLAQHRKICSFRDVELKLFTEKGGLLDLWHSLGERYSPNRAAVAMQQFRKLIEALIDGRFGQPGLARLCPAAEWQAAVDGLCARLAENGHPVRTTEAAFDEAARGFVRAIADLAARQPGASPDAHVFLEKTPHALLAMDFLDRVAPAARFVHVMRDPRSIAQSLRTMPWGPDCLDACATWVASYCEAWLAALARATGLGLTVHRLHIEMIAAQPDDHAVRLCGALGISPEPDLFARADLATLNGWADRIARTELDLLTQRLGCWVHLFGYREDVVGVHRLSDTSATGSDPICSSDRAADAAVPVHSTAV